MPDPITSLSRDFNICDYDPEAPVADPRANPDTQVCSVRSEPASAVQQLVSQFDASTVLKCRRLADIPGNPALGLEHHFLATSTRAGGAGHCGGDVPGHGKIDLPLSPTCIIDHATELGRSGVTCEPVSADPTCVNEALVFGKPLGPWAPPFNDCQTFVSEIIAECGPRSNHSSGGSEGAPGAAGEGGTLGY